MHTVTIDEASTHLADLIAAALRGEPVDITTNQDVRIRLMPVTVPPRRRKAGSARGKITMAPDFDAPLADFAVGDRVQEDTIGGQRDEHLTNA